MEGDVEGLIHISETDQDGQGKLEEIFKAGEPITAKVMKVDCEERKIALSVREYSQEPNSNELQAFSSLQSDIDQSFGRAAQNKETIVDQDPE